MAEDPVGVGEGVEKLQGGSRGGSAGCIHACADRPVVGVDFEAGRVHDNDAQIAWGTALAGVCLNMELLDIVAFWGMVVDLVRVVILFTGEGLGEGVRLCGLEDPDGLIEDLEGDEPPLLADLQEIVLPFDGPEVVLYTDIRV